MLLCLDLTLISSECRTLQIPVHLMTVPQIRTSYSVRREMIVTEELVMCKEAPWTVLKHWRDRVRVEHQSLIVSSLRGDNRKPDLPNSKWVC
jgi:hypothetical protein